MYQGAGFLDVVFDRAVGPRAVAADRVDALTTLLFDTTKADLKLSLEAFEGEPHLDLGRSIAFLSDEDAQRFIAEVKSLVERFDAAHAMTSGARPYALVWALYPSSRTIS